MRVTGPAVIAIASLMIVASPSASVAAQRTPAGPAAPLDSQRAQDAKTAGSQDSDRDTGGRQRTGRWVRLRERLLAVPDADSGAGGGFSPTAGTVVSGSGLAAGARYRRVNVLPHGLDAQAGAMVSLRGYQEYALSFGWMDRDRSTVAFDAADTAVSSLFNANSPKTSGRAAYLDVRHRVYPRHRYFGVGMESRPGDQGDYTLSGSSIDGVFQHQFTPVFGLSVRGGWMHLHTGAGHDDAFVDVMDRFAATGLPGLERQSAFVTMGAGLVWDARDNPRAPEAGWLAGTSLRQFAAVSGAAPSFARATIDVRGYQRIPGGTVAVRSLASADLGGSATPFYLQASLGGPNTLRGFSNYRFTDRALAHLSVEYRWRAHRYIEIAPFLDAGTVAGSWARLAAGDLEMTPGIGLRGRTDHRTLGRVDWSRSREGHRLTLGVGTAF